MSRAAAPRRIVAIGADITETIALLEGTGRLVGIDNASNRPDEVRGLPTVGFFRALSAEGIVALNPDLIIATDMLGPAVVTEQLVAAGIRIETLREPDTIEGLRAKINRIATLIGRESEGRALAAKVDAAFADLQNRLSGIARRPKVLFVVALSNGTLQAAGNIAPISAGIALAGGENAGLGWGSVKQVSREVLMTAPPALILTTPEIFARAGGGSGFLKAVNLQDSPDLNADCVMAIDTGPFFLFGPSTPAIARDVAMRLHPQRF